MTRSPGAEVVLRLSDVDKRYPGVHALKALDLSVKRGEVHALVGENGAGKSTLVGIAAGTIVADRGVVEIDGQATDSPTPGWSRDRGLAIVHQEPALLPDLTVAENMRIGVPARLRPRAREQNDWAAARLRPWRDAADIDPRSYVRDLRPDERFVAEIARALAEDPMVLVLDEPTEHLLPEGVAVLFESVGEHVRNGGAVVYISHRLREVKQIADTITVLRDGASRGSHRSSELTEDAIVDLILGRQLDARFPPKRDPTSFGDVVLEASGLRGPGFSNVDLALREGEIVGLAGIEGQGQRGVLRALAGLTSVRGKVFVNGERARIRGPASAVRAGVAYLPNDRRVEGVVTQLSVRENLSLRALRNFAHAGFVRDRAERAAVQTAIGSFGIKATGADAAIDTLSGGNQQKVMLGRTLLRPRPVLLADEPTQGVDVGARADIYSILRSAVDEGACAAILSADAAELAGLCDRVLIFSRGTVVAQLAGDEVSERNITSAILTSTGERDRGAQDAAHRRPLRRVIQADIAPSAVLAVAIALLGIVAVTDNEFYFTERNFSLMLPLFGALAFFCIGQQLTMLVGGIDLSVGSLASLVTVLASYWLTPASGAPELIFGLLGLVLVAVALGATNWTLVTFVRMNPMVATLVTLMGVSGIALTLRETPGGMFGSDVTDTVESAVGFVPVIAVAALVVAVILETALRRSLPGIRLRGVGSDAETANKVGIPSRRIQLFAYIGCSLFALLGALCILPQVGSGNATAGASYALPSIAAVVLGGASIFGGRGSFVGAVLGAALIVQINTVVQFLGLVDYWQQWLLGGLTIVAAALYSKTRALNRVRA